MTFLALIAALFLERVLQHQRARREHRWFLAYCDAVAGTGAGQWLLSHRWAGMLLLLPLLLSIGWLQAWFSALGSLADLAFAVTVLYYSLGPRDLGEQTEAFVEARDRDDPARADALARDLCGGEVETREPGRSLSVARAVVVSAAPRLFGPIFWFVVFGAVGAATYRMVHLLADRLKTRKQPSAVKRYADELRHVADWAPARLAAISYAIAGNFGAVADAWRTFDYVPGAGALGEADQLLARTGLAALDTYPDHVDELAEETETRVGELLLPPVVEDALALVWRSLATTVLLVGGGSLVAALA